MFADPGRLLTRLVHAVNNGPKITFLFGSALTAQGTRPEEQGVPDVNAIIQDVLKSFHGADLEALQTALKEASHSSRYQKAMQFMIDCQGQGALNSLVAQAVLKARKQSLLNNKTPEQVELDTAGWYLRPGAEAVGRLIAEHPHSFSSPILTSNFDPLLEVSLRKSGTAASAISLSSDGQFTNYLGVGINVVHFHGFWRGQGNDTLHTPTQLSRFRPQLKGCLRRILRETVLVVMGYGGWSDVFTKTLVEVISEQTDELDVLWTFYSDNEDDLRSRNKDLLDKFEALAGQRVVLYKGVDCHVILPRLREKLVNPKEQARIVPVDLISNSDSKNIQAIDASEFGDHPPRTDVWVGREGELRTMFESKARVIAITGLGGNGKSTLAAKYLEWRRAAEELAFYRWCDCKEQANTLHTQLVRMIEAISLKEITASQLKDTATANIIDVLFEVLGQSAAILVFDNIDTYIDLDKGHATGAMHILLEQALYRNHSSRFIFTGRPTIDYGHPNFLTLRLEGLSISEAEKLFLIRGVELDPTQSSEIMEDVHALTQGHALALNLIATQVSKNKLNLADFLAKLKPEAEQGIQLDILPEIWSTLNAKQQTVLRYLAELVHPETEQRIAHYLGHVLKFNQFSKAIRALKALSLIVVKSPGDNLPEVLDLHPLIRDFIKRRFQKEERIPYIHSIILVCDRLIIQFRSAISKAPHSVLSNWTDKIELCLECEQYDEALEVLHEVHTNLLNRGLTEEFIRLGTLVLAKILISDDEIRTQKRDILHHELIQSLTALGRFSEADLQIEAFEKAIPVKTARYLLFCNTASFSHFLRCDYDQAKKWASEGVLLKQSTGIDTKYDCGHCLALAQRETQEVESALKYFCHDEPLTSILDPSKLEPKRGGPFYGNIGRCFFYQSKLDEAIVCLKKSAKILETSEATNVLLNRGWAASWIGDALEKKQDYKLAFAAFKAAAILWKSICPSKANQALESSHRIKGLISDPHSLPQTDEACESTYFSWIKKT